MGSSAIKALNKLVSKLTGYSSIIVFLGIMIWAATDATLPKQKAENCELIINNFFNIITNNPDHVLDSNLFLYSIDLRNFSKCSPITLFKGNHGAWCDFIYLRDVQSPRGREFKGRKLILAYRDIYKQISYSDRIDIPSMKDFLNGTIGWNRVWLNYENDEDDDNQSSCIIF